MNYFYNFSENFFTFHSKKYIAPLHIPGGILTYCPPPPEPPFKNGRGARRGQIFTRGNYPVEHVLIGRGRVTRVLTVGGSPEDGQRGHKDVERDQRRQGVFHCDARIAAVLVRWPLATVTGGLIRCC